VLVGCLVAMLLGPGLTAGAEPRTVVTSALLIPATAAIPTEDGQDYAMSGSSLTVGSLGGRFAVPLSFPVPVVTIRRITVYAYDNSTMGGVVITLNRSDPRYHAEAMLCQIGTTGMSLDDPRTVASSEISEPTVNTATRGLYLRISMVSATRLYGVKILYSYETTP
jgi:hypothetical protein